MKRLIILYIGAVSHLQSLPPLIFRLILVHGFYEPAKNKLLNIQSVAEWFAGMGIPFPTVNAYLSAGTEALGCVLLFLGLATRFISVPLMVVMVVAIKTVHFKNGFACGSDGYQIPFYFFFLLFSLVVTGAGRWSLDAFLAKKMKS